MCPVPHRRARQKMRIMDQLGSFRHSGNRFLSLNSFSFSVSALAWHPQLRALCQEEAHSCHHSVFDAQL